MTAEHTDSRDLRIGRILNEYLDRKARGDAACESELLAANPDLADELRAHFGTVRQVRSASPGAAPDEVEAAGLPVHSLPGYEILGEIHRGGQGVVYQAIHKATRRKVAIKVMREGPFAGWRDRVRFEREVQVLAALRHPSIAAIHDSGVAAGCQYFVMDYICGSPLDGWLAAAPRTREEILRLFVGICEAVNSAHLKGIIHRDLKPGNIRIDDEQQPHILDFGLAKVADQPDPEMQAPDMTAIGQFVGSLPWTSPEQAQGTLDQVDTRTDVYALGVILYHSLTGSFPYEVTGAVRDVLNRIVSSEPLRPAAIAAVDGELEAIVLKCLRKEPQHRYQTAGELGRDIQRYLRGEAVAARGDSGIYLLRKMLRRHRAAVAIGAAFAILVGASLLASLSLWRRAADERDRADIKAAEAEQARMVAERERRSAQGQAERLRRITYQNRVALARSACDQNYMTQARALLVACPPDLRGWEWHYLLGLSMPRTLLDVQADRESVLAVAVSSDGQRIITAGGEGAIRIWDAGSGAAIARFTGHVGQVKALALSLDGRWIASTGLDRTLRLWDAATGIQKIIDDSGQYVNCVAFSPDSACLVAGGQGRRLTFRALPGGTEIRAAAPEGGEISCLAFSPDGKTVASGEFLNSFRAAASRIRLWDAATGAMTREWEAHPASTLCLAFSPDGRRLASGSSMPAAGSDASTALKVFDAATGQEVLSLRGHDGFVDSVAFSPDGRLLASTGARGAGDDSDHTLKIWDASSGAQRCVYSAHAGGGKAVAWSPNASRVFSGGMDGKLKAWPGVSPPDARILKGGSGAAFRIAFSPDGKRIATSSGQRGIRETSSADNCVRIWDTETGSQLLSLGGHKDAVPGLAWSPDGARIASSSVDGTVRLWAANSGAQQRQFVSPNGIVQSVAFSRDGELLGGIAGNTATLWTIADGSEFRRISQPEILAAIAFSPDGEWLATGSVNGAIEIHHLRREEAEPRKIATGMRLMEVAFSSDSRMIATAHANGSIALWNVADGGAIASMSGSTRAVHGIDFSPDGRRIVSCGTDMIIRIWDVHTAGELYAFRGHDAPVTCVRFSPDGRRIASCGQDGLIKIREAAPLSLLEEAHR